jgi:hypothetical protein
MHIRAYLSTKTVVSVATFALLALVIVLLAPSPVPASPLVTWTPASVAATVTPDERKTIPVSFTVPRPLGVLGPDIVLRVPQELAPFVGVEPARFERIRRGETVNINLFVTAPADAQPQAIAGDIKFARLGLGVGRCMYRCCSPSRCRLW